MPTYAGIDLGATYVRAIVGNEAGEELASHKQRTPGGPDGDAVTEAVLETLRHAAEAAGVQPTDIRAVGIGSIGPFDLEAGAIDDPANLPDAIEWVPLTGPIGDLVDSDRIYLHNDTDAGVIGERFYSEGTPENMVYLTISTGIGAGVIVDGNVLEGWDGNAGEVGHMYLDPDGALECGCGRPGHWETYCSGNNIPRYARLLYEEGEWETEMDIDSAEFEAADVYAHAGEDEFADHVIDKVNHWNTMGLTNIVDAYAPSVVYIGGGVAYNNPELVIEDVAERIEEHVFVNVPEIEKTNLGDDVGLKGALASALTGGTGDRSQIDD